MYIRKSYIYGITKHRSRAHFSYLLFLVVGFRYKNAKMKWVFHQQCIIRKLEKMWLLLALSLSLLLSLIFSSFFVFFSIHKCCFLWVAGTVWSVTWYVFTRYNKICTFVLLRKRTWKRKSGTTKIFHVPRCHENCLLPLASIRPFTLLFVLDINTLTFSIERAPHIQVGALPFILLFSSSHSPSWWSAHEFSATWTEQLNMARFLRVKFLTLHVLLLHKTSLLLNINFWYVPVSYNRVVHRKFVYSKLIIFLV